MIKTVISRAALERELKSAATPERATGAAKYFKTGEGEYGAGDVFLGVTVPAMRKIALGRRNYLFAGSDRGGERAAAIYTLVVTARLNGLNPEAYLKDILTRIADGQPINRIDELMPWRMTSTSATASQPA